MVALPSRMVVTDGNGCLLVDEGIIDSYFMDNSEYHLSLSSCSSEEEGDCGDGTPLVGDTNSEDDEKMKVGNGTGDEIPSQRRKSGDGNNNDVTIANNDGNMDHQVSKKLQSHSAVYQSPMKNPTTMTRRWVSQEDCSMVERRLQEDNSLCLSRMEGGGEGGNSF